MRALASLAPYLSLTRLLTVCWMLSSTPSSCLSLLRSSRDCAVDSRNSRRAESSSSSLRLEVDIAELGLGSGDIKDTDIVSGDIGLDIEDCKVLDSGDIGLEEINVLDSGETVLILLDSGL